MIDPDISTADAKRLLSSARPSALDDTPGPGGWTRRRFLQAIGAGVFGGMAVGAIGDELFRGSLPEAWAGAPLGASDGVLVVITMYGGNDGMNTLIPWSNARYAALRSNIAISADAVLKIDGNVGLHPQLSYLKQLYDAGQVAVLQGVGYPNPDLSHFTSMAIWMGGNFQNNLSSGWVGRWLDNQPAGLADVAGASIDTSVPLHMIGANRRGVAISPYGDMFGTGTEDAEKRMYDGMRAFASASIGRGPWADLYASQLKRQLDLAADVAPVFATELPYGELTRKLTVAARLINAGVGLRIIDVGYGGFDNHTGENGEHPGLMGDLNTALESFFSTLKPELLDHVTLMTVSEFGRTPDSNDSGGTDHGTAAPHFVIGQNVRGGLYGQYPSLVNFDGNGRMVSSLDFRDMYGSVLEGWMGGGASGILGGGFNDLKLFQAGPGTSTGRTTPIVVIPTAASPAGYTPITPLRAFDTRDGTGGRTGPLNAGETWSFSFDVDKFQIPGDAVAAAINLTSVDASASTFVTVFPTGDARPFTANLNPVPGKAVPNLVVARLGTKSSIDMYNLAGTVHLVGDLVGWFRRDSDSNLVPLDPSRLLDTRDGTGGFHAAIGPGQSIDLQVTGRGGVPADATAVAINVAVTQPSAGSYLTVWPTGEPKPLAASINMVPNQTVPNMVLAGIGKDGKISIFNYAGSTHVVVDVLGAFQSGAAGRFVALSPSRALDTREGTGAAKARVGQTPLVISPLGKNGIPDSNVSAVLMNVTAVQPTQDTFLTVYPSGTGRPVAANLNVVANEIIPNMVLGRVGSDGGVAIFNYAGTVDIVADIMGYFTT